MLSGFEWILAIIEQLFWSGEGKTIGVQTRRYLKGSMFKINAASLL